MEWVLIFWLLMDRGGGPATADFTTKERCEAAGRQLLDTARHTAYRDSAHLKNQGNFICVPK